MERRLSVLEQFTSFIRWREDNRFQAWQSHPRLHRRMTNFLSQDPTLDSTQYWVLYWHQRVPDFERSLDLGQSESYLALLAYLQEPCYQAAFTVYQHYHQRFDYDVGDYFGMTCVCIPRLLSDFSPELNPNLGAYAYMILKNRILDELRKQDKSIGWTIWGLLLHSSERRYRQAIERAGFSAAPDGYYVQLWLLYRRYGREAGIKRQGKIQAPNSTLLNRIYLDLIELGLTPISPTQVGKDLKDCALAVKNYLSLPTISSNQSLYGLENLEMIDTIADSDSDDEVGDDYDELQARYHAISTWLANEIDQFNPADHKANPLILKMAEARFGHGKTQTEISKAFGPNQSTVGRNLAKLVEILAGHFIEWAEVHLGLTISPEKYSALCDAIELWLQTYFRDTTDPLQE